MLNEFVNNHSTVEVSHWEKSCSCCELHKTIDTVIIIGVEELIYEKFSIRASAQVVWALNFSELD